MSSLPASPELEARTAVQVTKPALPAEQQVLVWDLPLRVFHWALVGLVTAAITTGLLGGPCQVIHGPPSRPVVMAAVTSPTSAQ